ncbi:MAG TPA: hypothetical protein VGJ21_16515 [Terracidiphilus sp.]
MAWKHSVLVCLILGFCIFVSHQDQKTRDDYENKCAQINAIIASPASPTEDCEKGAENAARHLPRWYRVFSWPEGITLWAILLTLLAIAEQTNATARAATASNTAVDVALMNTQAFINSERPWILVKAEQSKRIEDTFEVIAVNNGRTPAAVLSSTKNHMFVDIMDLPPKIPEYGKPDEQFRIILPGESFFVCDTYRLEALRNKETDMKFRALELGGYIFGSITYRDLLSPTNAESHETRWCFHILPGNKPGGTWLTDHPWGDDGYTRHT